MPFSPESIDFLFENRIHDSKEWFNAHKDDYKRLVTEPMTELILELAPTMEKIDNLIICDPRRISRIYRDARLHPDSIFRDHIWYTFSRVREQYMSLPGFYFSIGAGGMSFGCGYYCAKPATMEAVRQLILADNPSFTAAQKAVKSQKSFTLYGDMYKKNRFPEETPEKCNWLNRKSIGLSGEITDPEIMITDKLGKHIAKEFRKISCVYDLYMKAESTIQNK